MTGTFVDWKVQESSRVKSNDVDKMSAVVVTNDTAVVVTNDTAVVPLTVTTSAFEGASTTDGILTTEYNATKSNTVSINSMLSLNCVVATPLFYTAVQLFLLP
jgi:mRNA-degrading endonuclease toxin of MazEF toxin-antitoxin module